MLPRMATPRPVASIRKDNFRQRNKTIKKKANDLAQRCGAQVYLVVLFHGQYYTYTSHHSKAWPPSEEQIVRQDAAHKEKTPLKLL